MPECPLIKWIFSALVVNRDLRAEMTSAASSGIYWNALERSFLAPDGVEGRISSAQDKEIRKTENTDIFLYFLGIFVIEEIAYSYSFVHRLF